jgi:hypothetical protein
MSLLSNSRALPSISWRDRTRKKRNPENGQSNQVASEVKVDIVIACGLIWRAYSLGARANSTFQKIKANRDYVLLFSSSPWSHVIHWIFQFLIEGLRHNLTYITNITCMVIVI